VREAIRGQLGIPLLLRKVPAERQHLAEALAGRVRGKTDTWWELADAAASADEAPATVAITSADAAQLVHVDVVSCDENSAGPALVQLLRQLLAALRRTDALAVSISAGDPSTAAILRDAGFVPAPVVETSGAVYVIPL
jgi:hypothetical protein